MRANTAAALINSVAIISFTVLAVVFNKWWIALFGLLFFCTTEHGDKSNA